MRVLVSSFCIILSQSALALSPPWYTHWAQVKATLGSDPCVKAGELKKAAGEGYEGVLQVCDRDKAQALAALALTEANPGAKVTLIVQDAGGNSVEPAGAADAEAVRQLVAKALTGNPYFAEATLSPGFGGNVVWAELQSRVVSLWADNLADKYSRIHYVSSVAFGELFRQKIGDVPVQTTIRP